MSNSQKTSSKTISDIYKSRKIILELAKRRGFAIEDYENFNINDVGAMFNNKQLDMLLTNPKTNKKIYYKYHIVTKIRPPHIHEYIEDLYNLEEILTKNDDLVIVTKDKPNESILNLLVMEFNNNQYFVNIYDYNNFTFNCLDNVLQPKFRVLTETEKNEVKQKFNIISDSHFPEISRFDPAALAIGIRPGEVTEITRRSPTSLESLMWRLCNSVIIIK